jgi:phospho-N-acetylmuramoyl-pentapeptide-transferase
MTFALLAGLAVFILLVPWGGWLIRQLLERGIGKHIRLDGPAAHQVKTGTPTMGGLYFIGGSIIACLILAALGYLQVLVPVAAMTAFGLLGAVDDWIGLHDKTGVGWLARTKFPVQWGTALLVALVLYWLSPSHPFVIPGTGRSIELGWWVVLIATPLFVFFSNAVNLTDGQDGLAGGMAALSFGAFGLVALIGGQVTLSVFGFVVVGSLCAFLWYNAHPARIFMGDIGSEALGAGLVAMAMLSGYWLLLPVIGLVFIIEGLSVMLQVSYFKYTKKRFGEGRRILRMSPLHHHYELRGIPEELVTVRFWLATALCCAAAVAWAAWL